jgi:AraC-like DNA-binding protein
MDARYAILDAKVGGHGANRTVHDHWVAAVTKVIETMQARLDEPHPLTDISRSAFLSPFHFHRVFCQVTSATPARFLTALRIGQAKRLLLETSASCTEISIAVGYSSFGTFTSQFTRLVGVSPGRFRRHAAAICDVLVSAVLDPACAAARSTGRAPAGPAVSVGGRPDGLPSHVVIGVFRAACPQERPVGCAVGRAPGTIRLREPAEVPRILAVSAHPDATVGDLLTERPRAGLCVGVPAHHRRQQGRPDLALALRHRRITDPPMVFAFPLADPGAF